MSLPLPSHGLMCVTLVTQGLLKSAKHAARCTVKVDVSRMSSSENTDKDGLGERKISMESSCSSVTTATDSPSKLVNPANRVQKRSTISARESDMLQKVKHIVPKLTSQMHKGQCGRIAVFGGCILYTGAPYFAAISALKCGADLVHVFCEKGAGTVIKGYSPELIVHPVLDTEYGIEEIDQWLPRLHVVVLGPGLGRNQSMLGRISLIMDKAKSLNIPIVVDADGLWHLATNPAMLKGYTQAVITPNAMEFSRLVKSVLNKDVAPSVSPDPKLVEELAHGLGNLTVIHKGATDLISNGIFTEDCATGGSPRRCGGQGDLLSGSLATFLHWANMSDSCPEPGPGVIAAWGAARLARGCAEQAYNLCGRSVTTTDMIDVIHPEFSRLYESETFL